MKAKTILFTLCMLLLSLPGCNRKTVTTSASVASFSVNSDTGVATGQAFGIEFQAAGASGAAITSKAGGSPGSSSHMEIALADDLKIGLETRDDGNLVAFQINGKSFGNLKKGDKVEIAEDRSVMVNGGQRVSEASPPEPEAAPGPGE
jgi:hypothetical protein